MNEQEIKQAVENNDSIFVKRSNVKLKYTSCRKCLKPVEITSPNDHQRIVYCKECEPTPLQEYAKRQDIAELLKRNDIAVVGGLVYEQIETPDIRSESEITIFYGINNRKYYKIKQI